MPPTDRVAELDELQKAARVHNIDLSIHRVAKGEEIAAAIDAAKASAATALNVSASPLFFTHRQLILDRVAALRRIRRVFHARPLPMGSVSIADTMGIVVVACLAATAAEVLAVTMTSGLSLTNSAAKAGRRAGSPSE